MLHLSYTIVKLNVRIQSLQARIVHVQVPVRIHIVEAIPRSAAQKIQRWKLAEQLGQAPEGKTSGPPSHVDALEEVQLAWQQELGARPAQPTDNFFGSGAGSMQAAALASNLSSRLSLAVDSALVISHPQPETLARELQDMLLPTHRDVRLRRLLHVMLVLSDQQEGLARSPDHVSSQEYSPLLNLRAAHASASSHASKPNVHRRQRIAPKR